MSFESKKDTIPNIREKALQNIQDELAKNSINLIPSQMDKLNSLDGENLDSIHQEIIRLAFQMEDINKWERYADQKILEWPTLT